MSSSNARLSQLSLLLRNGNPEVFDAFVEAVHDRMSTITVAVTEAPSGDILVCQGRAQESRAFLRILRECNLPPKQPKLPVP